MANIRDLKKEINYVLGDIIDAALIHQGAHPEEEVAATESIIDDAIKTFDDLMERVNDRKVENRSKHLTAVRTDLEKEATALVERINSL